MSIESAWAELGTRVRDRRQTTLTGVDGLGFASVLLPLAEFRPIVVVARNRASADELTRDLQFLAGERAHEILFLPPDEKTPYHSSSPDPLVVQERSATLFKIASGAPFRVVVLPPRAFVRRGLPFSSLQAMGELVVTGSDIDREALVEKLVVGGYTQVNAVEDPGTFAVRGSIIDVFWAGAPKPVRIDLFGDTIESIRAFDAASQRAQESFEEWSFGPAREIFLDDERCRSATTRLRELADEVEFPTKRLRELIGDLEHRIPFFGIEGLLPAFHPPLELPTDVLDHALGKNGYTLVFEDRAALYDVVDEEDKDFRDHHRTALTRGDLCYKTETFIVDKDAIARTADEHTLISLAGIVDEHAGTDLIEVRTPATADVRSEILKETMRKDGEDAQRALLGPLVTRIASRKREGRVVLLPVSSAGGTERLKDMLKTHHLEVRALKEAPNLFAPDEIQRLQDPSVHAWTYVGRPTPPARGAELPHLGVVVIAEDEIFGKRARRGTASTGRKKGFGTTLADLSPGDHVVHVEHGIGVYRGLTRLKLRGVEGDFVLLTYADDDKLYLPVHRINLIQRYSGTDGRTPKVDKLGGTGWQTTRKKVKKAVLAMAQELLHLYAKRELARRPAHSKPDEPYWEFEAGFPFETTTDQQKAIDEVMKDMTSERPMDRLICGDVGYGKTEVGMRAAALAVLSGRQVVVLAPTTVLAQQHYLTFKERFAGMGATVEVISRFRTDKEAKDVVAKTKEGKIDVLIGTHRVLSNDISFKNLGLVIVDEEQRFGVGAKEKMKKLRTTVDMLTLTATPIPRTLQMGFFGIRDLSVIETAPIDRRAIRTSIIRFDDDVIREAVLRELGRSGQVYFVHNRVRSIYAVADYLKRLVPEARIGVGHGQMTDEELERVMLGFLNHEINIFVCTAIIETGIDVPTANTMFIDNADDFGLAQLYQLRGRVGRSKERAFAYLLVPGAAEQLTPDARKRLEVLQRFSDLGAGFKVAQHDLELRGAGDLLGRGQHGHITAVGYDLYTDLLKDAVEELRGRTHDDDTPDPDVTLPVAAYIPDKYLPDVQERLSLYQRLATAKDGAGVYDVVGEMSERYGDPPSEVTALAEFMILKMRLREMAARALELGSATPAAAQLVAGTLTTTPQKPVVEGAEPPPRIVITLGDKTKLDVAKLTEMATRDPTHVRLTPQGKLIYTVDENEWRAAGREIIPMCREVLRRLLDRALAKAA
jgi:transcription-repair coupling factor (superfamily II helicase)